MYLYQGNFHCNVTELLLITITDFLSVAECSRSWSLSYCCFINYIRVLEVWRSAVAFIPEAAGKV